MVKRDQSNREAARVEAPLGGVRRRRGGVEERLSPPWRRRAKSRGATPMSRGVRQAYLPGSQSTVIPKAVSGGGGPALHLAGAAIRRFLQM